MKPTKKTLANSAKGFSLIELVVAGTMATFVLGSVFYVFSRTSASARELMESQRAQQDGLELANYLLAAGRQAEQGTLARPCGRVGIPANLRCELQFSIQYGDGSISEITFLNDTVDGSIAVEESKIPGTWFRKFTYVPPGVRGLEICGDTELTAGTCPIRADSAVRDKLEVTYANNVNGRFFRFRVKLASSLGSVKTSPDRFITGAFFGRNPIPDLTATDPSLASLRVSKQQ